MRYFVEKMHPGYSNDGFWDDRMMPQLGHPMAAGPEVIDTGLITPNGARIMRSPDDIGFLPRRNDVTKDGKVKP